MVDKTAAQETATSEEPERSVCTKNSRCVAYAVGAFITILGSDLSKVSCINDISILETWHIDR